MAETDGLYDTSEPALSNRLARFRARFEQSPAEHAMHAAVEAIADLKVAVWTVKSREQLNDLRLMIEAAITDLTITASVALTRDERWDR